MPGVQEGAGCPYEPGKPGKHEKPETSRRCKGEHGRKEHREPEWARVSQGNVVNMNTREILFFTAKAE